MRKLSAVAFVIITTMITAPLPAIAYTQADADACKPDAMRLCASAMTRSLLDARNRAIVPLLPAMKSGGEVGFDDGLLSACWPAAAKTLKLLANLSNIAALRRNELHWGEPIWGGEPPPKLPPWSVYAAIGGA